MLWEALSAASLCFKILINRVEASFHVCWWKVTINHACFWHDCETSIILDSQAKNVVVKTLRLHPVGAAERMQLGNSLALSGSSLLVKGPLTSLPYWNACRPSETLLPFLTRRLRWKMFASSSISVIQAGRRKEKGRSGGSHIWSLVRGSLLFLRREQSA